METIQYSTSRPQAAGLGTEVRKARFRERYFTHVKTRLARNLTGLDEFVNWYDTRQSEIRATNADDGRLKPIKIAVLDNGFDHWSLGRNVAGGETFFYQGSDEINWFLASDVHGTQMATFVKELNPSCELYLAKVGNSRYNVAAAKVHEVCGGRYSYSRLKLTPTGT